MSQTESYSWGNYYSGNKGKQLMVATSVNPGAGFGDPLSVFVTCRSGVAHLSPIYCRLARGRVPNVSESQVSDASWWCPTPRPASVSSLSLCAETSQIVRMSLPAPMIRSTQAEPSILLSRESRIIATPTFCERHHQRTFLQPRFANAE